MIEINKSDKVLFGIVAFIVIWFFIGQYKNKEVGFIPSTDMESYYVITNMVKVDSVDRCIFTLKSLDKGGSIPYYDDVKMYRGCNFFKVGDTLYFAPIRINLK